jgi:hypothetical protein
MLTKYVFCFALFLSAAMIASAQWGSSVTILHLNNVRIDPDSDDTSDDWHVTQGFGTGVYYVFPESQKRRVSRVRTLGLDLQILNRSSDLNSRPIHASFVSIPLSYHNDIILRQPGSTHVYGAITTNLGVHVSKPIAALETTGLSTDYTNLGFQSGLGLKVSGPYGMQFKLAYALSIDLFTFGKDVTDLPRPNTTSRMQFLEQGFQISVLNSFSGQKELRKLLKSDREIKRAERKALKKKRN